MKYIIIGGVAGGATAAARIRRNTEKAEIILFEKGEYISYANCGLPYYIGGVIEDRERLFVQTPESFGKRFNIDIRTRSEVTAIDVKKKEVTVRSRLSCPGIYRVRQSLSVCYHILFSVPVELQTAFQSVHHSIP